MYKSASVITKEKGDKIDEDQLRRYPAQMEDFRRENESKMPAQTPLFPARNAQPADGWESNNLFGFS
jgi:hypothetical protein